MSIITTQAIASAASTIASGATAFAATCKSVAMLAGHKISIGVTTYVLPAVKLAWVKFAAVSAPALNFVASPLGMSIVGMAAGAFITTIGISLIITSRGEKLEGDVNNATRRAILCSGIALSVVGAAIAVAGGVGTAVVLI